MMSSSLEKYAEIVGSDVIDQLHQLVTFLKKIKVVHINSTKEGGGVAEILHKLIPLKRELGIDARWEVIEGNENFFKCTKSFHNALQGNKVEIPKTLLDEYENVNRNNAERLRDILVGWDGLGGYHGLLIKKCVTLRQGKTVLDVGCGLCHLFEGFKKSYRGSPTKYIGVDNNSFILGLARERYSELDIEWGHVYDLSRVPVVDTVFAIGLYSGQPRLKKGIVELVGHAERCVILTYFAEEMGVLPSSLEVDGCTAEFIDHDIDERLEIIRLWKL